MSYQSKRGWFGESHRHYLAGKGISSKKYYVRGGRGTLGTALQTAFRQRDAQIKSATADLPAARARVALATEGVATQLNPKEQARLRNIISRKTQPSERSTRVVSENLNADGDSIILTRYKEYLDNNISTEFKKARTPEEKERVKNSEEVLRRKRIADNITKVRERGTINSNNDVRMAVRWFSDEFSEEFADFE